MGNGHKISKGMVGCKELQTYRCKELQKFFCCFLGFLFRSYKKFGSNFWVADKELQILFLKNFALARDFFQNCFQMNKKGFKWSKVAPIGPISSPVTKNIVKNKLSLFKV